MQTDAATPTLRGSINVPPPRGRHARAPIIFMVVTPMMGSGADVQVPEAEHATEHPDNEETLVVSLKGNGTVFVNDDDIPANDLLPALSTILDERTDKTLWVKANESLDYGYVLEMMDRCRTAGATDVALITKVIDEESDVRRDGTQP